MMSLALAVGNHTETNSDPQPYKSKVQFSSANVAALPLLFIPSNLAKATYPLK